MSVHELPNSERFTVTLIPRAVRAVNVLMGLTGLSKTDTVNRAVQVYAFIEERREAGGTLWIRDAEGGESEVHII